MDLTELIVAIIENPMSEKGYRDLKKHYQSCGMENETEAIEELITKRFNGSDCTPPDQE